ncbi:MAG: zinc ribbon domain-containing protein [Candidatus Binatia bacterium]
MSTPIELLAALQAVDQRLKQKESTLQELRQRITSIAAVVETKEQEGHTHKQRIEALEVRRRETELELKEKEGKIKEKRVKQNRIRNERELMAVRREIELMKEENEKLEEEGIQLLEQIEGEKGRLDASQAQIEELKEQISREATSIEEEVASLEAEVKEERREREKLTQGIDVDLCARYERIFAKRGGVAVVEIRADTCQGCYMRIPPQMSNQIRSSFQQNAGTLFHCPHCGRILHWRPVPEGGVDA